MKNTIKKTLAWIIILTIFVNKYYNFNPFVGQAKINNFLDIIVSPTDLIVGALSFGFFILTFFYNYLQPHTKYFITPTISHLFVIVTLLLSFLIHPSLGILMIIARLFLLINIIPKLLSQSNFPFRITLLVGLALSLAFDHFVLSSSLPVLLLFILSLNLDNWQKKATWLYIILNMITAFYQIIQGHSIGLLYLGEPIIDANTLNIARENISGVNILRGYGLTQHPSLLGFVAIFGLLFVYKQYDDEFYQKSYQANFNKKLKAKNSSRFAKIITIATSILSLSRVSLMTFLFDWIITSKSKLKVYSKIVLLGGILGLFVFRFLTSDQYRILDLQTWLKVTINMNILDVFIGVGYYPDFLYKYYEELSIWQFQPTHNTILGFFTQFGVWGSTGILGWLYYDLLRPYFDNKKKKQQQ